MALMIFAKNTLMEAALTLLRKRNAVTRFTISYITAVTGKGARTA